MGIGLSVLLGTNAAYAQLIEDGVKDVVEVVEIEPEEMSDSTFLELEFPDYLPWEVVTLEGKLKMQGLPLSPTVKIFMERDSLISASMRAPFLGEVGRLEITPEKLLVVNKMSKTFMEQDLRGRGVIGDKVLGIREVQALLLGRFFLPGIDIANVDLEEFVDIFYEDDQFNVIPKDAAVIEGVKYGFAVDQQFNPTLLVVMPNDSSDRDLEVAAEYFRKLSGYDLTISYSEGDKNVEMKFEFKSPEWKGEAPKGIDLGKYKRVGLKEIIN